MTGTIPEFELGQQFAVVHTEQSLADLCRVQDTKIDEKLFAIFGTFKDKGKQLVGEASAVVQELQRLEHLCVDIVSHER